jgi:hypothetical protein
MDVALSVHVVLITGEWPVTRAECSLWQSPRRPDISLAIIFA